MGKLRLQGEPRKKKKRENIFRPYAREYKPKIKYSKNRAQIHHIAKQAKDMGISYGEWVARYDNER